MKVVITKSAEQAEKDRIQAIELDRLLSVCPECGASNKINKFSMANKCSDCGTEWSVERN